MFTNKKALKQFDYSLETNYEDAEIRLHNLIVSNDTVGLLNFVKERVESDRFLDCLKMRDAMYKRLATMKIAIDRAKGYIPRTDGRKFKCFVDIRETTRAYREVNERLAMLNNNINDYRALNAEAMLAFSTIRDEQAKLNGTFISYDADTIGELVAIGAYDSGSDDWHAVRQAGIGGSDVAKIMKVDHEYGTRDYREVLMTKLGLTNSEDNTSRDDYTTAVGRGNAWEEAIRIMFQDNHPELNVAFCKTSWEGIGEYSYRHANFDGLMLDDDMKAVGILEIKTGVHMAKWGNVEEGIFGAPENYRKQILWYAMNANLSFGALVAVLDDYDYREYHFTMSDPRIIAECDEIRQATDDFWNVVEEKKVLLAEGQNPFVSNRSGFPNTYNTADLAKKLSVYTGESFEDCVIIVRDAFGIGKNHANITPQVIQDTMIALYAKHDPRQRKRGLVGIDIETNHTSTKAGHIIETGIIVSHNDGTLEEVFDKLHGLSEISMNAFGVGAEEVHHISTDMIEGKASFDDPEIQKAILDELRGKTIVAHNANFEDQFLTVNLYGYAELRDAGEIDILDTMYLSRYVLLDSDDNSLKSFAEYNGIEYVDAHRALNDTRFMMQALRNLQENLHKNGRFVSNRCYDRNTCV